MELLAPAGGFDQLRAAVNFGADAVYLAAERFGMRARAANFSMEELPLAVAEAHAAGVSVYVTCNVMVMQDEISLLPSYLEAVNDAGADALIIGDLGAFSLARKHAPDCKLHVSTQASVANSEAAKMWHSLGASRIVCAREMTLADIAEMRKKIPADLEIEAFVHGAQCMAVSGRCLISAYLTGRSGNRGECTQPCRWEYTLEEEKRPGVHFPIEEDNGAFIMNAKDLCMIEHMVALEHAGVDSAKIEGRNKKAFYVATVVGAYRRAIDATASMDHGEDKPISLPENLVEELKSELYAVSHRPYSEGFFFGDPQQAVDYDGYEQETLHVADVVSCESKGDGFEAVLRCRNRFAEGDKLEVLSPRSAVRSIQVKNLRWLPDDSETPVPVDVANRAMGCYLVEVDFDIPKESLVRARSRRRTARHE